jgi:hypothetical protein
MRSNYALTPSTQSVAIPFPLAANDDMQKTFDTIYTDPDQSFEPEPEQTYKEILFNP